MKAQLLDNGIASTWNDNNEFEVWDDSALANLNGRGGAMACLRPVQTGLMLRASALAQQEHRQNRPFLVTRSGGPGLQRYAQTWTGDNRTDWKTLRYNLRMGHGLSLSGIFNFGHDVGGFAGRKPEPELFMRWIEQGIYWPRFTIHSWNDDGSANEPWMYPEILPLVRAAMEWRERLVPLLYTLMWRAHAHHEPILRPLFFDFPDEAESYEENDAFHAWTRCSRGANRRARRRQPQRLAPEDRRRPVRHQNGRAVALRENTGLKCRSGPRPPLFAQARSLPPGRSPSWAEGPLTLRLFPLGRANSA